MHAGEGASRLCSSLATPREVVLIGFIEVGRPLLTVACARLHLGPEYLSVVPTGWNKDFQLEKKKKKETALFSLGHIKKKLPPRSF